MRIPPRTASHVVLLLAAAAAPSAAAVLDVPVTPLVIRIYDAPAIASGHSLPALKEAHDILAAAGFAAEWVGCAMPRTSDGRCGVPLGGAELAVRVVVAPRPAQETRNVAMGYSLVDPGTRGGALATVYLDRVTQFADTARSSTAALLGRAIAHEIGHLLLGTTEHGRAGVMRAFWSHDVVRRSRPHEWRFTPLEARRMRDAVTRRETRGSLAAHVVRGD